MVAARARWRGRCWARDDAARRPPLRRRAGGLVLNGRRAGTSPRFGWATAGPFGVVVALAMAAILFPWYPGAPTLEQGQAAPWTVLAASDIDFESDVLTQQARDAAANAVEESFRLDPEIGVRQLSTLRSQLAGIDAARQDESLSDSARESAIRAVPGVLLSQQAAAALAAISGERWPEVGRAAEDALSRTLAGTISASGVEASRGQMRTLLAPGLSEEEFNAFGELLDPLVAPTLVVDSLRTAERREEARSNQPPVRVSRVRGEVLVAEGEIINAASAELLDEAGLRRDGIPAPDATAAALIAALVGAAVGGYLLVAQPPMLATVRRLGLFAILLLLPALGLKTMFGASLPDIEGRHLAYLVPIAAAPMAAAVLLDVATALLLGTLLAGIAAFVAAGVPYADVTGAGQWEVARASLGIVASSMGGLYFAARATRLSRYLMAGLGAAVGLGVALLVVWLLDGDHEVVELAWIAGVAASSGMLAALIAVGAFVMLSRPFGIITRVELMELAQLSHPLLRRLQDEAPGTFQHAMLVGNLAERAADRIGADPLLVRVGAYYHDVGKLVSPPFFVENFGDGENPHDRLDPLQSTRVIQQHVTAGIELARRAGLPEAVVQFIPQHHGMRMTTFFYRRAAAEDPEIDPILFRYPGPKPQSRETALVMLADSCEATVRSAQDRSGDRIREIVEEVIRERIDEGEFDECDISLRDLRVVAESFVQTLNAVYHPRVEYPEPTDRELADRGRLPATEAAAPASLRPRARPEPPPPAAEHPVTTYRSEDDS